MPLRVGSGQARTSLQWKGTWKPANSGHGLGQSPGQRGKKLLPSLGYLPPANGRRLPPIQSPLMSRPPSSQSSGRKFPTCPPGYRYRTPPPILAGKSSRATPRRGPESQCPDTGHSKAHRFGSLQPCPHSTPGPETRRPREIERPSHIGRKTRNSSFADLAALPVDCA